MPQDKKGRPTEPNDALQMALQRSFAAGWRGWNWLYGRWVRLKPWRCESGDKTYCNITKNSFRFCFNFATFPNNQWRSARCESLFFNWKGYSYSFERHWSFPALSLRQARFHRYLHICLSKPSSVLMYRHPDALRLNVAKFGLLRWFWWAAVKKSQRFVLQQSKERWEIVQPKQLKQLCHDLTWFHSHENFNGNCGFSDFSGIQEGTYNGWLLTVTLPRQSTTIWTRNGSGSFWMFLTMRNPSENIPPNMMLLDHQGYLEDPKVNFQGPLWNHQRTSQQPPAKEGFPWDFGRCSASEGSFFPDKVSGVTTATICERYGETGNNMDRRKVWQIFDEEALWFQLFQPYFPLINDQSTWQLLLQYTVYLQYILYIMI